MRIALGIEYDGGAFNGWQRQSHAPSVQEAVERAVSKVADHPVGVVCAGRTDTGVHATAQVVHFDTSAQRRMRSWILGANANLPPGVSVTWARSVTEDFHARFKAQARQYRYVILNRMFRPALLRDRVCWDHNPLEAEAMHAAAQALVGEHDFSAFRALACQASHPVRTVHRLEVARRGDLIYLDIEANAFLHHMVRNIAGTLIAIGRGDQPVEWAGELLAGRDRSRSGITAPAGGLYFVKVSYPAQFGLPWDTVLPWIG